MGRLSTTECTYLPTYQRPCLAGAEKWVAPEGSFCVHQSP